MVLTSGEAQHAVLTIGHSTRSREALVAALKAHGVRRLVDIRTIPRSRHNPQFNREELAEALPAAGIAYEHRAGLGGLRRPLPDSPNDGWRNAGFRGFADYMQTADFARELERLLEEARSQRLAIMCAEAVPWRCHRSLVADALTVRGMPVEHIIDESHCLPHKITAFACIDGTHITYPAAEERLL